MQRQEENVNMREAVDAGLVVTESSGSYTIQAVDADIRPVHDDEPFAEVQLTALHNILANEQQHTEQSKPSYDTHLLEIDSNTTPDSTNMCHRGGEIDQDAEHDQVKSPLLKAEFLKTNDMVEKEVYNELSNRFLQLEKHCISLEISIQQKEESNEPRINNYIDVIETINIELEHKVAKLLKENEHLKQTYKELYDSIKKTRIQTKDHNDSLIAQVNSKTVENADLKAQIQEKVFANVALKNELRKLKGNSMDTKFAKPSILGKPVLQPPRNQSVVRQPNAFKSERPNFSKPRFASQVDVNNVLSKPVTPYYLPKVREYVLAKPHHVIAPGSFRNSQEEPYGSNDMAHNHYLEEARKKTQERNRNSKPSVMHTTSLQNTTNGSKPNTRSNNQISRSLPVSKSSCGMSNGVLPRSKTTIPLNQRTTLINLVKPTGRIFKTVSLRWIPTGKVFIDSTTKVDSEPPNGSNDDITNPYECNQTLYVSAGTSNSSAGTSVNPLKERLGVWLPKRLISHTSGSLRWVVGRNFLTLVLFASDSNVEYLRANLNIKGMSNSRRTSLSNIDYMLYPSLLRTVTDWKGKPSLRSTERSLLHDNIVPKPDLALELGKSISLTEAEEEAVAREVHATHARIVSDQTLSKQSRRLDWIKLWKITCVSCWTKP
ncbi:hypothetical protein Tco_0087483 [Tanacetum coccineum]